MNIREWLHRWWNERKPYWVKRPYCWVFGHDTYELPGWLRPHHNTHFCGRCLKFWRLP